MTVSKPRNLQFLYLMEVFSGLARAYLVCTGWTRLVVTDDVARVGQVFVVAGGRLGSAGPAHTFKIVEPGSIAAC